MSIHEGESKFLHLTIGQHYEIRAHVDLIHHAAAVTTAERQELLLKVYAQNPEAFDGIPGQYFAEYLEPRYGRSA